MATSLRVSCLALLLAVLAGCSSSSVDTAALTPPIPAGKAQLTIKRESGFTNMMTKVNVDVNGARLGEFAKDDGYTTFINPGRTTVSAASSSPSGRYAIAFNALGGKTYRLEITSRPEGYLPPAPSGPFTYEVVENEGAFKIMPAD